ncbi:hypothetical protein GN956_G20226 [Arapaima gigas]
MSSRVCKQSSKTLQPKLNEILSVAVTRYQCNPYAPQYITRSAATRGGRPAPSPPPGGSFSGAVLCPGGLATTDETPAPTSSIWFRKEHEHIRQQNR